MTPLFKKLNLKEDTASMVVLNAPESFRAETEAINSEVPVVETLRGGQPTGFMMAFVTQQQQVDDLAAAIASLLLPDAVLWFCYPKGSSKKYTCNFNRDTGWASLGQQGFEPVRMIAIDADWSALRLRQVQHIKKMTRQTALSDAGKTRVGTAAGK